MARKKESDIHIYTKNGRIYYEGHFESFHHRDLFVAKLKTDDPKETFGYKLRRFIRRFAKTADHWFDEAAQIALGTDVPAAEVPYIGLLEDRV